MLGGIGCRRRRGRQRMRWLHGIMDSMGLSLSELREMVMNRRPGVLWFMGLQRFGHIWATELNWTELCLSAKPNSNISHGTWHIVGTHQMSVSFTVFLWRFYSSFDGTSILSSLLRPILYHVFISKFLEKRNDVLFFSFAFHKVPFIESNWVGLSQMKLSEKKSFKPLSCRNIGLWKTS